MYIELPIHSTTSVYIIQTEEIVGNPAYSSSSDTSKSDPVSFQFKEPRLTECREVDFFARARSRPDPRIISHAPAGKNIQEPRSCDTFVECGSSRTELYDNSTILVPTSNTSIFDTFATVARDVEPTHGTSVRDKFATQIRTDRQRRLVRLLCVKMFLICVLFICYNIRS